MVIENKDGEPTLINKPTLPSKKGSTLGSHITDETYPKCDQTLLTNFDSVFYCKSCLYNVYKKKWQIHQYARENETHYSNRLIYADEKETVLFFRDLKAVNQWSKLKKCTIN